MNTEPAPSDQPEASSVEGQERTVRSRFLTEEERVWEHNAWDNFKWTEELEAEAELKIAKDSEFLSEEKKADFEANAADYWDKFYQKHGNHFFKDRHYLHLEFEELLPSEHEQFNILEMGCGAGNTVFPILKLNPTAFVYAFDFSEEAVNIVKANPEYDSARCNAFRFDPISEEFPSFVKEGSINITTMIYLLSAIPPHKMDDVLRKLNQVMKPGGTVLFRDYAKYDLTQLRFKKGHRLAEKQYVRGDGTLVYYFTQDELQDIFLRNGFETVAIEYDRRLLVNRLRKITMHRVWLQAKFRKIGAAANADSPSSSSTPTQ